MIYDDEGYSYLSNASVKYNISSGSVSTSGYQYTSSTGIDAYHTTLRTYMSGKKLTQITSSTDIVNFKSATIRQDLDDDKGFTPYGSKPAKSLDTIEIKTGSKCQNHIFSYAYFQDPSNIPSSAPSVSKKLRLESITQKSCDNLTVNPPYTFTYEGTYIRYRLSKAIDHWGYYNGANLNETNVVNIPPTNSTFNGSFGSSNRETNEIEMKKGVLTEINFPTGGKTTFTYEANSTSASVQSSPIQVFSLNNCSNPQSTSCCGYTYTGNYYTVTGEDISSGSYKLQLTRTMNYSGGTLCSGGYDVTAHIYVYDANWSYVGSMGLQLYGGQNTYNVSNALSSLGNFTANSQYFFELDVTEGYGTFTITKQPWITSNVAVGGLRIKQIKTHDGISVSNDIVKDYDYNMPNTNNSSGILLRKPNYLNDLGVFR